MWNACSFMLRTVVKRGLIPSWGFGIPGWSEARAWTNACLLQWPLTSIGASEPTYSTALALDTLWTHACTLFAVGRGQQSLVRGHKGWGGLVPDCGVCAWIGRAAARRGGWRAGQVGYTCWPPLLPTPLPTSPSSAFSKSLEIAQNIFGLLEFKKLPINFLHFHNMGIFLCVVWKDMFSLALPFCFFEIYLSFFFCYCWHAACGTKYK